MARVDAGKRPLWVFDGVVALLVGAVAVISLASISPEEQELYRRVPDFWSYAFALAQTLPLALRRIRPIEVLAIVVAAFFFDRALDYPSSIASIGVPFAFHSLGSQLPRRRSLQIGIPFVAFLVAFTSVGVYYSESVDWGTVFIILILTIAPLLLGQEVNERRRYLMELEERADRLERERGERTRRAVREERARIARELHDVVAHEMTVMTVQAAGAKRVLDSNPQQVAEALTAIESAGHDALTEMRRLLGLLRQDRTDKTLGPQPGLGRLEALVEQMEEAGLPVRFEMEGEVESLSAGVDLNAYRIIQESLTNSLKHGGPQATASVFVRFEPDRLLVEVADDGRGAAGSMVSNGGAGHGLVGMQERAAMLGGTLKAGPKPGGGFIVKAVLPRTGS